MPHRLGNSELHQVNAKHLLYRARIVLRRSPNAVQVHSAELLQRAESLRTHAAFSDYGTHAVTLDDIGLIRLFANARRGSRRFHHPAVTLLQHDGTAMVQRSSIQI